MNNQEIKAQIDQILIAFYQEDESLLSESICYSIQAGGKRFRPILLVKILEGLNFKITTDVLKVGAALEMIHTSSLIHDDLPAMDNDDYRRGMLTNHKKFGEANAILAGDALLLDPYQLLSTVDFKADIVVKLISALAKASGFRGMVGGQSIDINSENQTISYELLKELHAKKTGAMIVFPFIAAGIIAGVPEKTANQLQELGERIGLAFQIRDDIIDVTESFETLGKTPQKDIAENKATYVSLFGLEKAKQLLSEQLEHSELLLGEIVDFNANKIEPIISQLKIKDET
ncbi:MULTISPECIES: polyprenyl synthetase family protein [unclassified Enterococcus]|uniref:polyprenyl synthetase family protein n=1 Tax=unclassified Enterococcus TaxID=2608891 RepID=UPI0015562464|nr:MULTISPECIES: farnesyl diphosphate synthase [unclassified Enterococcus]MBS7575988.1 polyprenyl synthetase family protein [Enterococcus sp. MMGLQ5-2]MBS7583221.1 polyprenyl synthetase family protein [Enterococcus sp. MMGLQ5-1]NPD11081.1 polyprenyl synthetase family protein [Enterococcus sp. MMGLQ5-1]NPD35824.1 polyprenyl synthetase family protein [Enterococcus sp. MMGLQ5-2]